MFRAKGRAVQPAAVPSSPPANGNGIASPLVAAHAKHTDGFGSEGLSAIEDGTLKADDIGAGKRTRRSIPVVPLAIGVGIFVVAVAAAISAMIVLPKFKSRHVASASSSGSSGSDDDKSSKSGAGRHRPGRSGRSTPAGQRTELEGEFPNRRALLISVNNYLYMNPTLYGSTKGGQNITTLMERFRTGLRIPKEQMAQLSDATPTNPIKPTKKAIEDSIAQLLGSAREEDCLILMFAGHVVEATPPGGKDDETCLVPLEGVPNKGETLIPISGLLRQMEDCPARQKVLILDVCRLNPGRGLEFPGSGPDDSEPPGSMWKKLDEQLAQPPEGVQVWTSCLTGQYSYELEQGFDNSVFLDALDVALKKIVQGTIQIPEEVMPLPELVDFVNGTVKETLAKYTSAKDKRTQVSRLTGTYYEGGVTYDENSKPLPRLVLRDPVA
jgi:hypothetical protein